MSSINLYPTFKYSQPEGYHFSHDSVFLARKIFEAQRVLLSRPDVSVLDLCAGCGIVGLDLLFHQLKEEKYFGGEIDFLEVQEIYNKHFEYNIKSFQDCFSIKIQSKWIQINYADEGLIKKYDLIVSNPPYFLANKGKLSNNDFKNRCRFFIDSDWQQLIQFIKKSLKKNGLAYFLVRDELKEIILKQPDLTITFPFQIRGTWVAFFKGV